MTRSHVLESAARCARAVGKSDSCAQATIAPRHLPSAKKLLEISNELLDLGILIFIYLVTLIYKIFVALLILYYMLNLE